MIFVPLPFVVALLLTILLVRMVRQNDWAEQEKRPFLLLIGAYTLQSIIIGIRWGYDVLDILPYYDTLLIMTVEPGFGGQSFMADMMDKVRRARTMVDSGHLTLLVEVDGGINADTIAQAAEAGADCFVAGSAVYGADDPAAAIASLRRLAAR